MIAKKVPLEALAADVPYALVGGPFGSKLTSADYVEEGVPVIRGTNLNAGRYLTDDGFVFVSEQKVQDDLFGNLAHRGDLVFTQRGTLGQVALIPADAPFETYVVSQSQMKMTVDPRKADARFIYYCFTNRDTVESIVSKNSSSGVPHINLTVLRKFEVPVPDLDSQTRIADWLSAYDDLIENNRRRIALLEEAARLLYREWFVHLRFPGHEHVKVVDGVPEEWERRYLADVVTTQYGHTASAEDEPVGPKFLRGTDINKRTFIDWSTVPYCPEQGLDFEKYALRAGDILVIRMADPGKVALVEKSIRAVFASYLVRLQVRDAREVPPLFLFQTLLDDRYQGFIGSASGGATRKTASAVLLTDFHFVLPPRVLLELYVEQVQPLRKMITTLIDQSARAGEARDVLLPRLMNGEIAV